MNQKMVNLLDSHCRFMEEKYGTDLVLLYGPAHVVYDDYGLETEFIENALIRANDLIIKPYSHNYYAPGWISNYNTSTFIDIMCDTIKFLRELLAIPEDERYVYEEDDA